jgi:dTDP-4-amino-4,6-dideoxygalactose transaminase
MQSAIGRIQLKRMREWFTKRNNNANAIASTLAKFDCIRLIEVPDYIEHAQYKYYAFVKLELLNDKWTRDRIVDEINTLGVPCFQGSCSEVYLEKAFDNTNFRPKQSLPIAKGLGETSLMFLIHPTLTSEEIDKTCSVIGNILKQAGQ